MKKVLTITFYVDEANEKEARKIVRRVSSCVKSKYYSGLNGVIVEVSKEEE